MQTVIISAGAFQLSLEHSDTHLLRCDIQPAVSEKVSQSTHPLVQQTERQLKAYLAEPGFVFDLPLAPEGTRFQQWVWQKMLEIPAGEVLTYAAIAAAGNSAARAVGGACRRNPLPLFIPCHRVVSSNGIGGYCGEWQSGPQVNIKQWLLQHEGWLNERTQA